VKKKSFLFIQIVCFDFRIFLQKKLNILYNSPRNYLQFEVFIYQIKINSSYTFFSLADEERASTPTKVSRVTTPRRVQIGRKPLDDNDEIVDSETESISTAIDVVNDDDFPSNERISESHVDNVFANLVMNNEPLIPSVIKKKSPQITTKKPSSPMKFHHTQRTVSDISDEENTKIEEIPEELSIVNYSEDFSSVPTESSTPRSPAPTNIRMEKQPQ
jgi:hypothetical protein